MARAVWYTGPGQVELRTTQLAPPVPGQALVRTLFSGVSRGTERLVLSGSVGESEWERDYTAEQLRLFQGRPAEAGMAYQTR